MSYLRLVHAVCGLGFRAYVHLPHFPKLAPCTGTLSSDWGQLGCRDAGSGVQGLWALNPIFFCAVGSEVFFPLCLLEY